MSLKEQNWAEETKAMISVGGFVNDDFRRKMWIGESVTTATTATKNNCSSMYKNRYCKNEQDFGSMYQHPIPILYV